MIAIDEDESTTRNTALAQGVLNVVGTLLSLWIWRDLVSPTLPYWQAITMTSGALTLAALRIWPKGWKPRLGSYLFLLNLIPMFIMIWVAHDTRIQLPGFWVPFRTHKLSAVTLAILAPVEAWTGLVGIFGLAVLAVAQYFTFPPEALRWIPTDEPEATVAYAAFAVVVLIFRLRGRKRAREVVKANEQARMLKQSARLILAVRDLVNSPVQSLSIDAEIIRTKYPDLAPVAERIQRSVGNLNRLNALVTKQAEALAPHLGNESFNAQEVVESFGLRKD